MQQIGKVLWWDSRDQEGVLVDTEGNEIYFNRFALKERKKVVEGKFVLFELNKKVKHTLCAGYISLVPNSSVSKIKRAFEGKAKDGLSDLVA